MAKPKPRIKGHKRSCGEKHRFETMDQASAAARRGRWEYMEAYRCRKCKMFHYGHPSAKHITKFSG
jgi:hypothetical protein